MGDKVLILQAMTKSKSRYDPRSFKVTKVNGTQITATRGTQVRIRDAQKFKKVILPSSVRHYQMSRDPIVVHPVDGEFGFDASNTQAPTISTIPQTLPRQAAPCVNRYPNGHLDPNIPTDLVRSQRKRQPPALYRPDAWN